MWEQAPNIPAIDPQHKIGLLFILVNKGVWHLLDLTSQILAFLDAWFLKATQGELSPSDGMLARGHVKSGHGSKGCVSLQPGSQNVTGLSCRPGVPARVAIWLCDRKPSLSLSGAELTHYEMRMWMRAGVFTLAGRGL